MIFGYIEFMKKWLKTIVLFLCLAIFVQGLFAQTNGLPRFKKGESYTSVRKKMIKVGWKPFRSPNADKCSKGDTRCQGRPEMESCAGTGEANCAFLWKRKGKTVSIYTVGEDADYSGHKLN